jgi:hypothetical protein
MTQHVALNGPETLERPTIMLDRPMRPDPVGALLDVVRLAVKAGTAERVRSAQAASYGYGSDEYRESDRAVSAAWQAVGRAAHRATLLGVDDRSLMLALSGE